MIRLLNKQLKHINRDILVKISSSLFAIVLGLLLGLVILMISDSQRALAGFMTILQGGFSHGVKGLGNVLYLATPVIMTGLSVGFAFKTGLFNIGASGQLIVGAFCGIFVSVNVTGIPASVHWVVALMAAMIGGALWGIIPGILKAYFNVNEVIASIMMNYIGMYFVNFLVKQYVFNSFKNQSKDPIAVVPRWGLDKIFVDSSVSGGILIAIGFAIIVYIVLNKTAFGYELKACGYNMDAAKYAGINSKRGIVISMAIAGALSGIGGGLLYLATTGKSIEVVDILAAEGFAGIPVALLGNSHPIGIVFSAFFISHLTQGGFYAQVNGFSPEVIKIMTSVIIYFSAFALFVRSIIGQIDERRNRNLTIAPVNVASDNDKTEIKGGNENE